MQTRTRPHMMYSFRSLAELGEYIETAPRTWKQTSSEAKPRGMDWDLNATYESSVRMAREGWLEGADKAQQALKAFSPATAAPDTRIDFYGHMPHVPRFCAGAPDNMIRHARNATTGSGQVLTLAVPVNALAEVDAKYMSNFGTAVAQYVNKLETNGTRVELIGMIVSKVSGQRLSHTWTIKYADQPLDLAVVAFSIGHPAMFRRLGFALRERCAVREDSSYGVTERAKVSDLINPAPGTVILNGMANANHYAKTPEAALEYITKEIDAAIAAQELEQ